jgi:hypothetical protein
MPEYSYPDYNLSGTVLRDWLRNKFNDGTIQVQVRFHPWHKPRVAEIDNRFQSKNAQYVFTLPDGQELTEVCFT